MSEKRHLPRELIGETGVLKNRTEVTMTTTRLTQLPTEWVTGDTLARIMYDTFKKLHKDNISMRLPNDNERL
jgi:hypothetical protein